MDIKKLNRKLTKLLTESKKSLNEDQIDHVMNAVLSEYDDKVIALALYLDIDLEPDYESYVDPDASEEEQKEQTEEAIAAVREELDSIIDEGDGYYSYGNQEYTVYTDSEADAVWEEKLDEYIEERILPNIPEDFRNYFDDDAWKQDAIIEGRGHTLSLYDGDESEIEYKGVVYYIYRQS
jgi:hypothetical protein